MKPKILIDADGCPVVDLTVHMACEAGLECLILCDTSQVFDKPGAQTLIVSKGADSVDFALVNRVQRGDIVVTQDYGLAAMCLARGARVLRQDARECAAYKGGRPEVYARTARCDCGITSKFDFILHFCFRSVIDCGYKETYDSNRIYNQAFLEQECK